MSLLSAVGIFLTESCNLACAYCYAANMERRFIDRSLARQAVDMLFLPEVTSKRVSITFWGGEPLLAFDRIQELTLYARQRAKETGKEVDLGFPTNTILLDDKKLDFCLEHRVSLSLSLDGDEPSQALRRLPNGGSSFALAVEKIELIKRRFGQSLPTVRMTVSPDNVRHLAQNLEFFLDHGFRRICFAPVVEVAWTDEQLAAYEQGQLRLVERFALALEQGQPISFNAWDKVLAWRECLRLGSVDPKQRRFDCGAGVRLCAVDIHGDIYPCHRFVFYDKNTRAEVLGNVRDGLPQSDRMERYAEPDMSLLGRPGQPCTTCASRERCYAACPAVNYALTGNAFEIPEALCLLAELEQRVAMNIEERIGTRPAFRAHLGERLVPAFKKGVISAEMAGFFASFGEAEQRTVASRAAEILAALSQRTGQQGPHNDG